MTRSSVALIVLLGWVGVSVAGPPQIATVSEGVENGQTALVFGEGFVPGKTEVLCYVPEPWQSPRTSHIHTDQEQAYQKRKPKLLAEQRRILSSGLPALPAEPPKGTVPLQVLKVTEQVIAVVFSNRVIEPGVQCRLLWVKTPAGLSRPYRVNRPVVWWKDRDSYEPGAEVTLYGRNLASGLYRQRNYGLLRAVKTGQWRPVRWGTRSSPHMNGHWGELRLRLYCTRYRLPHDLAPGSYRLYVHNASGARWGWSDAVDITVQARKRWPRRVFDVRQYGAVGNGVADDTGAIAAALAAAGKAGGGIVFAGPGTYIVTRTLTLPERTVLKGAGREITCLAVPDPRSFAGRVPLAHQAGDPPLRPDDGCKPMTQFVHEGYVPVVRATCRFGIEDLTLRRDAGDGMLLLCDNTDEPGHDVFIRRVRLKASALWFPEGTYRGMGSDGIVLRGDLHNLEVDGCWIEGMGGIRKTGGLTRHARIVNNTFVGHPPYRSRFLFGGRGWTETVVMNNTVRRAERGVVMAGGTDGPGFVHNLIARNTMEENAFGNNAGETYCVEMGRCFYFGPVAEASAKRVRLAKAVLDTKHPWQRPAGRAGICLVVRGRGLGQYRWVVDNTGDTVTLARPWRVVPDGSSMVCVMRGTVESLWIENMDRHGEAAMQMYDFWVNNVLDGHVSIDTEGMSLWGYQLAETDNKRQRQFAPVFFNQMLNGKLRLRGRIRLVARTDPNATKIDAPFLLGNTIRNNQVYAPLRVSLNQRSPYWLKPGYQGTLVGIELMRKTWGFHPWPKAIRTPATAWTLLEHNHVYKARVGVSIDGAVHTLLRGNRFDEVATPVVDKGSHTFVSQPSAH